MDYKSLIIPKIAKAAIDEYTAVVAYDIMGKRSNNPYFQSEMTQHSAEEKVHFDKIEKFCFVHGIELTVKIDNSVIEKIPYDDEKMFELHQQLEKDAIDLYYQIVMIARNNNDYETEELFSELLKDEMEHFDDVAVLTGEKRTLKFS